MTKKELKYIKSELIRKIKESEVKDVKNLLCMYDYFDTINPTGYRYFMCGYCKKHHTMDCPSSGLCFVSIDKPFFELKE